MIVRDSDNTFCMEENTISFYIKYFKIEVIVLKIRLANLDTESIFVNMIFKTL